MLHIISPQLIHFYGWKFVPFGSHDSLHPSPLAVTKNLFFLIIFIFSILVGYSVLSLFYCLAKWPSHKHTHTHTHIYAFFFSPCPPFMLHDKWLDTVLSTIQEDLIVYPFQRQLIESINSKFPVHLISICAIKINTLRVLPAFIPVSWSSTVMLSLSLI